MVCFSIQDRAFPGFTSDVVAEVPWLPVSGLGALLRQQ